MGWDRFASLCFSANTSNAYKRIQTAGYYISYYIHFWLDTAIWGLSVNFPKARSMASACGWQ